jgi:hypothetical protein
MSYVVRHGAADEQLESRSERFMWFDEVLRSCGS